MNLHIHTSMQTHIHFIQQITQSIGKIELLFMYTMIYFNNMKTIETETGLI